MKGKLLLLAALALWLCCAGCGDDNETPDKPTDTGEADAGDTETETVDLDTGLPPTVALEEDFENWDGSGHEFFMAKPQYDDGAEYNYEDNATMVEIDGQNCIKLHDNTVDNDSYGFAIELQMALDDAPVDMSFGNFTVDFDVYVPQEIVEMGSHVQFGFYWIGDDEWTPIYSVWFSGSVTPDEWSHLGGGVNLTDGIIDFSGFPAGEDPDAWIFDVFRIQLIVDGEGTGVGDEIYFYVDNIVIKNYEE